MANNIQIVGNILNVNTVSRYNNQDISLIPTSRLEEYFGGQNDYIELHIYNNNQTLINSDYSYLNYKLPSNLGLKPGTTTIPNTVDRIPTENVGIESVLSNPTSSLYPIIEIDPIQDLQSYGYSSGKFSIRYNLFENRISNFSNQDLFIKEISKDRTEVRLASVTLSNEQIENFAKSLIDEIENENYYVDYLLNFGEDKQYVVVNVALNKATDGYEILFKLYQSLPLNIQVKQTLWVVSEKTTPYNFDINLDVIATPPPPPRLRGPNFDILVPNQGTVSTSYDSYQNLITSLQSLQNSSYQQILNLITSQSIDINIDYTDFGNFVFFGSAYQRLTNFYNKAKQIEDYNTLITTYTSYVAVSSSLQTTINQLKTDINNIISQFDGYESYLYFESSSYAWPKISSDKPYELLPYLDGAVMNWYENQLLIARNYDANNYTNLEYAIPSYLKDDDNNAPFLLFLNMIGHYFDNIWIYLKSIPDLYKANNNLEQGISKDLVYHQLKSLGLRLYNSQAGDSVDNYLIGANTGSNTWDNNTTITGSYLNNIPRKDLVSELYKRIYHNLPLLIKSKGTVSGLNYLMTIFGIPNQTYYTVGSESFYSPTGSAITSSILNVKEFGGSLKSNLINGYNNDKVRIVSNDIVPGNTLSHELSLQTFPVSSSQFRDSDMNYIDISFSPQTQIDTRTSEAIASNNPTWSLDDYIGDPRQLYNDSYSDLDTQRQLYYQTGVTNYPGYTGSLLNHNDFIRLIQYFDNALFKMLNDFVPERTSLSTGVTINSPVLERNKVVYANPTNTTTQSVYEGEISASSISAPYGTFYDALQNDKKSFFDGVLSGSIVNVNQYFEDNINPYLQLTGAIDRSQFEHSDWNVLLNNVSASVLSDKRKKIEYTGNFLPTGSITSSVELQDSYLTLRSYNTSRYEGSKTTSLKYNTYTKEVENEYNTYSIVKNVSSSFTINYGYSYNILKLGRGNISTVVPSNIVYYNVINLYVPQGGQFETQIIQSLKNSNYVRTYAASSNINIGSNEGEIHRIVGYTRRLIPKTNPTTVSYNTTSDEIMIFVSSIAQNITPFSVPDKLINLEFLNINPNYWAGDTSFGKTAAIDRQSYKVGWVKNIPSQSLNFLDKTSIQLKYLVDVNQNLTDLTLKNDNLFEVQNTFRSGDTVVLSLSDALKPSFQKTLDGTKTIFRGGYSYDPIFFRENYETLEVRTNGFSSITSFAGIKSSDKNWYSGGNSKDGIVQLSSPQYNAPAAPDRIPVTAAGNPGFVWTTNYRGRTGILPSAPLESTRMASVETIALYSSNYNSYITNRPWLSGDFSTITSVNISNIAYGNYRLSTNSYSTSLILDSSTTYAYYFDLIKPKKVVDNEDIDTTDNGEYLYKAPRPGRYNVKAGFSFLLNAAYFKYGSLLPITQLPGQNFISSYHSLGVNFKVFGILEGNTDPANSNNWKYKASTRIVETSIPYGKITVNRKNNVIHLDSGFGQESVTAYSDRPVSADHIGYFGMRLVKDTATDVTNVSEQDILIDLVQNEVLRFRVVILDLNAFFLYGRDIVFEIGTPDYDIVRAEGGNSSTETVSNFPINTLNNIPNLIKETYFEIEDRSVPKTVYDETVTLSGDVFEASENNLVLLDNMVNIYPLNKDSSSIFLPSGPTANYYSPVIDDLLIQPNDLIRIGSINNPKPDYYTVLSVDYNIFGLQQSGNTVTLQANASFFPYEWNVWDLGYGLSNNEFYSTITVPYTLANWNFFRLVGTSPLRTFTTTDTPNGLNDKTFIIELDPRSSNVTPVPLVYANSGYIYIAVSRNLNIASNQQTITTPQGTTTTTPITGIGFTIGIGVPTTFTQITDLNQLNSLLQPKINITLDRPIISGSNININNNFAILRPKPDETSVIINHKKQLGEVSQTILIPQDANDEIKNKVGTIFQALNVDLSNQSQNNIQ